MCCRASRGGVDDRRTPQFMRTWPSRGASGCPTGVALVEELGLKRCEEGFRDGVVEHTGDAAHRREQSGLAQLPFERPSDMMRNVIAVDSDARGWHSARRTLPRNAALRSETIVSRSGGSTTSASTAADSAPTDSPRSAKSIAISSSSELEAGRTNPWHSERPLPEYLIAGTPHSTMSIQWSLTKVIVSAAPSARRQRCPRLIVQDWPSRSAGRLRRTCSVAVHCGCALLTRGMPRLSHSDS